MFPYCPPLVRRFSPWAIRFIRTFRTFRIFRIFQTFRVTWFFRTIRTMLRATIYGMKKGAEAYSLVIPRHRGDSHLYTSTPSIVPRVGLEPTRPFRARRF